VPVIFLSTPEVVILIVLLSLIQKEMNHYQSTASSFGVLGSLFDIQQEMNTEYRTPIKE
jgi:hypothetical protein